MGILEALSKFTDTFAANGREGIDIGEVSLRPHLPNEPFLSWVTHPQIRAFYQSIQFDNLVIGGELFIDIFPLTTLEQAQQGWRFIRTKEGSYQEDTNNWNKDWLVFADRNGDAIFLNQQETDGRVFGSIQKSRNLLLASSLSAFIQTLTECMILENRKYRFNTKDQDFVPLESFLSEVKDIVRSCDPSGNEEEFMAFFFG